METTTYYCISTFISLLCSTVFIGKFFYKKPFRNIHDGIENIGDFTYIIFVGLTVAGLCNGVLFLFQPSRDLTLSILQSQTIGLVFLSIYCFWVWFVPLMQRIHEKIVVKSWRNDD